VLIGREQELSVLRDALQRVRTSRTSQLVTLVGIPGIGKSRLVHELFRIVDDDSELITWRQGRCLAYGDGVTLWALGEIVKAEAGIHEQDPPDVAAAKVRASVESTLQDSSDTPWVESNVLALVGLASESELGGDPRGQAFAAWRRYFEAMAEQRPLVLVVEDLHWADEGLLDFLDELVDWVSDVPLLVIGTARPELLERRPGWGGGKLNATTLQLRSLTDEQTALLISNLLERPLLEADHQQALLERAGGNPLYTEQFAELFLERGQTDDLPLPESLQGIIAARLDGLPESEKEILRDAAVVGKVFWVGSLSRDAGEAESTLHALERKGFVRRQRRTSVAGQSELAFAHALVRDVAYGQIPRADRVEKHRRVATWIESLGRPDDHAEMLAYHWRSALQLAQAAGGEDHALAERARLALRDAGDRAFALRSFGAAAGYYADALELWPDDATRAEILLKRARALFTSGADDAVGLLEEARDALLAADDRTGAAETEAMLGRLHWLRGSMEKVFPHLEAAAALTSEEPPSLGVARVLSWSARQLMLANEREQSIVQARAALDLAEQLGLDEVRVHSLTTIGSAKEFLSDTTGRDDLRTAVTLARSIRSPLLAGTLNNLSVVLDGFDLVETVALEQEALDEANRLGDREMGRFLVGNLVVTLWLRGDWDRSMELAEAFIAECEAGSPHVLEAPTRVTRGHIELARGNRSRALADLHRGLEIARTIDHQALIRALALNAWARLRLGDERAARTLVEEAAELFKSDPYARPWTLPEAAYELGLSDAIREPIRKMTPSPGREALLAVLDGDPRKAAELYGQVGFSVFENEARLRLAGELADAGKRLEAQEELDEALDFFRSLGATLFVEQGASLLARSVS
jgi:tetratricopeptide (TPR) repeat protein